MAVSKLTLFRLKNQMFFFNLLAIAIGVLSLFILSYRSISPPTHEIERLTFRIALIFACNLIPFLALIAIVRGTYRAQLDTSQLLELLRPALLSNAIFGISVGIGLTILVSGNITRPVKEIIRVLKKVRDGDFDKKVQVTSNDEIGYAGG